MVGWGGMLLFSMLSVVDAVDAVVIIIFVYFLRCSFSERSYFVNIFVRTHSIYE